MRGAVTVTVVVRDAGRDEYGDPVQLSGDELPSIDGCLVAPTATTTDDARGRWGTTAQLDVYAPPGSDLREGDHVELSDAALPGRWLIVGHPDVWRGPFTERGVVAGLRRAVG